MKFPIVIVFSHTINQLVVESAKHFNFSLPFFCFHKIKIRRSWGMCMIILSSAIHKISVNSAPIFIYLAMRLGIFIYILFHQYFNLVLYSIFSRINSIVSNLAHFLKMMMTLIYRFQKPYTLFFCPLRGRPRHHISPPLGVTMGYNGVALQSVKARLRVIMDSSPFYF